MVLVEKVLFVYWCNKHVFPTVLSPIVKILIFRSCLCIIVGESRSSIVLCIVIAFCTAILLFRGLMALSDNKQDIFFVQTTKYCFYCNIAGPGSHSTIQKVDVVHM